MDAFSKNKYLFWAVIILVALNIVLLSMFWFGHNKRPFDKMPPMNMNNPGMPNRNHAIDFMKHELELNDEQSKKFDASMETHRKKADELMEKIGKLRADVSDAALSGESKENITKLANEVGALHTELENIKITHLTELMQICDKKQNEKLKEIMKEIFSNRMPPPPGAPGMGNQRPEGGPPPHEGMPGRPGHERGCPPPPPPGR